MRRKVKNRIKAGPDPIYKSVKVAKLINYLMQEGKKAISRSVVYDVLEEIKTQTKRDPLEVFEEALNNVGPAVETRSRRVGGANYQIPHEVSPERRLALALRWLVSFARAKKGQPIRTALIADIMAAAKNEGEAVKKRETVIRMAEANRAFAHFARRRPQTQVKL